jgi:hypothetical protein
MEFLSSDISLLKLCPTEQLRLVQLLNAAVLAQPVGDEFGVLRPQLSLFSKALRLITNYGYDSSHLSFRAKEQGDRKSNR